MIARVVRVALLLSGIGGLAASWLLLGPAYLGGPATYVIVDGRSMQPALHSGDLVIARHQRRYAPGDVVAYHIPKGEGGAGTLIIHRVLSLEPDGRYILQGDNRDSPDYWRPVAGDIVGKMWFSVPAGGSWLRFLRQPLPLATLSAGLAMLLALLPPEAPRLRPRPRPAPPPIPAVALAAPLAGPFSGDALAIAPPPQRADGGQVHIWWRPGPGNVNDVPEPAGPRPRVLPTMRRWPVPPLLRPDDLPQWRWRCAT